MYPTASSTLIYHSRAVFKICSTDFHLSSGLFISIIYETVFVHVFCLLGYRQGRGGGGVSTLRTICLRSQEPGRIKQHLPSWAECHPLWRSPLPPGQSPASECPPPCTGCLHHQTPAHTHTHTTSISPRTINGIQQPLSSKQSNAQTLSASLPEIRRRKILWETLGHFPLKKVSQLS